MQTDERCCGTGTCLIDAQGVCWCGQRWDGVKMCGLESAGATSGAPELVQAEKETAPE